MDLFIFEMAACKLYARTLLKEIKNTRIYSVQASSKFGSRDSVLRPQKRVRSSHIFQELYPWKTKTEFIDGLGANVIYNQGNTLPLSIID